MIKILTIIGARPQFIKAAAISRRIKNDSRFKEVILHTGQHFDYGMSDIFFKELDIPEPNYNLGINNLSHGAMTGEMLKEIEKILLKEKPNYVVLYGDTNSTLAGALAAKKLQISVIHIEAGLRSFNEIMPEETNRILTDRMSKILFCPTEQAIENLHKEGYANFDKKVIKIGDVMYDTFKFISDKLNLKISNSDDFVLSTIHRAENTDNLIRLESIGKAFNKIAEKIKIILPMHPRTKAIIDKNINIGKLFKNNSNINIIEPVGYLEMVKLLNSAKLILTDSGGLQKDAYFAKTPCITLRDETEWIELVKKGYNFVVGADFDKILKAYNKSRSLDIDFEKNLYGNGNAGKEILEILADDYKGSL